MKIVCLMTVSTNYRVTGPFLQKTASDEHYYRLHREYREQGAFGFLCGRKTMQSSFTGEMPADLSGYEPAGIRRDHVPNGAGFYAIALDSKGRCAWQDGILQDEDPGYDRCQVLEILSEEADGRYLSRCHDKGIGYLFAGRETIDLSLACDKLAHLAGERTLLLEGGGIINRSFLEAGLIDELVLVKALVPEDDSEQGLFGTLDAAALIRDRFELLTEQKVGPETVICRYRKRSF